MAAIHPGSTIPTVDTDNTVDDPRRRAPLVTGGLDFAGVTENVSRVATTKPDLLWWAGFLVLSAMALGFFKVMIQQQRECGGTIPINEKQIQ